MSYSYWWSEIQTIRKTSYFQTSVQQFFRLYRLLLLIQVNTRINIMWWGLLDQWSTTPEILNRFSCRTLFSEYLLCNNCCGQNLIFWYLIWILVVWPFDGPALCTLRAANGLWLPLEYLGTWSSWPSAGRPLVYKKDRGSCTCKRLQCEDHLSLAKLVTF